MNRTLLKLTAALVAVGIVVPVAFAMYVGTHTIIKTVDCAKCHADIIAEQKLSSKSAHQTMSCTMCHKGGTGTGSGYHAMPYSNSSLTLCSCHSGQIADWQKGAHKGVECWQCHTQWTGTRR